MLVSNSEQGEGLVIPTGCALIIPYNIECIQLPRPAMIEGKATSQTDLRVHPAAQAMTHEDNSQARDTIEYLRVDALAQAGHARREGTITDKPESGSSRPGQPCPKGRRSDPQ